MDQYERIGILGRGSFGIAILVQEVPGRGVGTDTPRSGCQGARRVIKEIDVSRMEAKAQKEALAEVSVLRSLQHVNVIAYVSAFAESGKLYIVMEFADGGDLATAVQARREERRHFSEAEVLGMFTQCCLALHHIHTKHVLHRDLKCQNIFLTKQGIAKLGDFGIAKVLDFTAAQAVTVIGTPSYLPPEVCESQPYGTKADMWSLGVVFHELMALELPFKGSNIAALFWKILTAAPGPLPEQYSSELRTLETHMLQKKPEDRLGAGDLLELPLISYQVALQKPVESQQSYSDSNSTIQVLPEKSVQHHHSPTRQTDACSLVSPSSPSRPPRLPSRQSTGPRTTDAKDASQSKIHPADRQRNVSSDVNKQVSSVSGHLEQKSPWQGDSAQQLMASSDDVCSLEYGRPCREKNLLPSGDAVSKVVQKQRRPSHEDALAAALFVDTARDQPAVETDQPSHSTGEVAHHNEHGSMSADMSDFDVNDRVDWTDWGTQTIEAASLSAKQQKDSVKKFGDVEPSKERVASPESLRELHPIEGQKGDEILGSSQHSLFWDTFDAKRFASIEKEEGGTNLCDAHHRSHCNPTRKQQSGTGTFDYKPDEVEAAAEVSRRLAPPSSRNARSSHGNATNKQQSGAGTTDYKPDEVESAAEVSRRLAPPSSPSARSNMSPRDPGNSYTDMSDVDAHDRTQRTDWGLQKAKPSRPLKQKRMDAGTESSDEDFVESQEGIGSPKSSQAPPVTEEQNGDDILGNNHHSLFWDTFEGKNISHVQHHGPRITEHQEPGFDDTIEQQLDIRKDGCRSAGGVCTLSDPEQLDEVSTALLEKAEAELESKLLGSTLESDWPTLEQSQCEDDRDGQKKLDVGLLARSREACEIHGSGYYNKRRAGSSDANHHQNIGQHSEEQTRSSPKAKGVPSSLPPPLPKSQRDDPVNQNQRPGLAVMLREVGDAIASPASNSSPFQALSSQRGRQHARGLHQQSPAAVGSKPPMLKRRSEERSPNRGPLNQKFTSSPNDAGNESGTCQAGELALGEGSEIVVSPPGSATEGQSPRKRQQPKSVSPRRLTLNSNPGDDLDKVAPAPRSRPSSKTEHRSFSEHGAPSNHDHNAGLGTLVSVPRASPKSTSGQQSPRHRRRSKQSGQVQSIPARPSTPDSMLSGKQADVEQRSQPTSRPEHVGTDVWPTNTTALQSHPDEELQEIACVLRGALQQIESEPQSTPPEKSMPRQQQHAGPCMEPKSQVAAFPRKEHVQPSAANEYRPNLKAAKQIKARMEGGMQNCLSHDSSAKSRDSDRESARAGTFARERAQEAKDAAEQMHNQALQRAAAEARRDRQNVMRKMQELEDSNLSGVIQYKERPGREKQHQLKRAR